MIAKFLKNMLSQFAEYATCQPGLAEA